MTETIELDSVRRLDVKPGEILVFKTPDNASLNADAVQELADKIRQRIPEGVEVLILANGVDLAGVVSGTEQPSDLMDLPRNPRLSGPAR